MPSTKTQISCYNNNNAKISVIPHALLVLYVLYERYTGLIDQATTKKDWRHNGNNTKK